MHVNHRAGALAIQIKIADVELSAGLLEPRALAAEHRPSQPVLSVVSNVERRVKVSRAKRREHGTEDFFLRYARHRINFANHGRLDEPSALPLIQRVAASQQFALSLSDLDVVQNRTVSTLA